MNYYCYIDSERENTNLQLFFLREASKKWNKLLDESSKPEKNNLTEKLTLILCLLGLSLSQLLGQNVLQIKDEIDNPGILLGNFLKKNMKNREKRKNLNKRFTDFLDYYSAIRHFGIDKGKSKYNCIDNLTIPKISSFINMAIEIWDIVIEVFKKNKNNELDDLDSINDLVNFKNL